MAEQTPARRKAVMLVVLGIAITVLLVLVLIGRILGDNTGQIDPQNANVITLVGR